MEKGFNSDIIFDGREYHVQSEDWGFDNPYIVSRVYLSGAVVRSLKTPYVSFIRPDSVRQPEYAKEQIRLALRQQHSRILDLLMSGQLISG